MQFKFRWLELWLLIVATAVVTLMLFTFESSQGRTWTNDMWWLIGGFGGAFFVVHIFLCALAPYADQVLLPVASVLNGIGLLVIYPWTPRTTPTWPRASSCGPPRLWCCCC